MNNADSLRKKFLDFFKAKKHKIIESDSLVPQDDPTVLFTPAGMNQFKPQFLGAISDFPRAASAQRCLRTDDLDKVGKTTGHHTFFEMLGNFSFGDYFKKEAISWAWEFLTEELKINPEKLWVSVYQDDLEAYNLWKDLIKLPPERIIKLGDKENFWPSQAKTKGPNGPCGPCSEIFFDYGKDTGCGKPQCSPACGCGRFVEVWNLVFTQFERREGGILEPLPKKNIDTGMGLERLAAVMQQVKNNFETGLFQPIIQEIIQGQSPSGTVPEKSLLYVVADHIRAIVFALYDGVLPSNEGRGYIVRKLLRKSTLALRSFGTKKPFLYKLVPIVAQIMQVPYPELKKRQENFSEIILSEEKNFLQTLDSSNELIKKGLAELVGKTEKGDFSEADTQKVGIFAFQLYDTYGIPWELTKDWADNHGIKLSRQVFDKELARQRERSQSQSTMKGEVFSAQELHLELKPTKFTGYRGFSDKGKIIKVIKGAQAVKKITAGETAILVLDKTPFYAEAGGQVGDSGEIIKGKNVFMVQDTKKSGQAVLHLGMVKSGNFKVQDLVLAKVDASFRLAVARNHTATHLLQAALRKVLGAHVKQQGSLVAAERLRFDFTHFKDLTSAELNRVEEEVNRYILDDYPLSTKQMLLGQARKSGALAFFAEKYSSKVRVVQIGPISQELCGGTHLAATGSIGLFKIIHEGSVASGVRRIEAVTGLLAYQEVKKEQEVIDEVSSLLKVPAEKFIPELQKKLAQIKELERGLEAHKASQLQAAVAETETELVGKINFALHIEKDKDAVRKSVDLIKAKAKLNTVVVSSTGQQLQDEIFFTIGLTPDLCEKGLDAAQLAKELALQLGGSGGGRKDFAQAGGRSPGNFPKAIEKLKEIIRSIP